MERFWTFFGEEIEAVFCATLEKDDYGVSGSPVFWTVTHIDIDSVSILGKDYDVKELPKGLVDDIMQIAWDEGEFQ